MRSLRKILATLTVVSLLASATLTLTLTGGSAALAEGESLNPQVISQSMMLADTGKTGPGYSIDADRNAIDPDYFHNYHQSGGDMNSSRPWLWDTSEANPALFKYDLPDGTIDFEPFVEFDNASTINGFEVWASADGSDWKKVA